MAENEESDGIDDAEGTPQSTQGGHQSRPAGGQRPRQGGGQPSQNAGGRDQAPRGQAPQGQYRTGPSVGDIFSIEETKDEMKLGAVVYGAIGLGIALAAILLPLFQDAAGVAVAGILLFGSLALGPGLAGLLAVRQDDELEDQPDKFVYANAAVTGALGTVVMGLLGGLGVTIGASIGTSGPTSSMSSGMDAGGLGDVILPLFIIAIGAAVTAAFAVWAIRSLLGPGSGPVQPEPAQQPAQPRR